MSKGAIIAITAIIAMGVGALLADYAYMVLADKSGTPKLTGQFTNAEGIDWIKQAPIWKPGHPK